MTLLLTAVAALAAGYCIGHHTGRTLRRAATHIDAVIADIETHWNEDAA